MDNKATNASARFHVSANGPGEHRAGFRPGDIFQVEHLTLVPYVPAGTAISFVNTYNLTALTAGPSIVLFFYELLNAKIANAGKILDHAHSVLSLITGV
jgi:hypothetical protein